MSTKYDLVAQCSDASHRWRRKLDIDAGGAIVVGRENGDWSVAWDNRVSRKHVEIRKQQEQLVVQKLTEARNPVFFQGKANDQFILGPGQHFVIGKTTFTLVARIHTPRAEEDPGALTQQAFDLKQLRRNPFQDAGKRIDVLGRLPDLINSSTSDEELWVRVGSVLLQGISSSAVVAVVGYSGEPSQDVNVKHFDSRVPSNEDRAPSAKLIRKAITTGESVLHLWSGQGQTAYTASEGMDWAFCVPIAGDGAERLGLYVAGAVAGIAAGPWTEQTAHVSDNLKDDLKFTELVANTITNIRSMRHLQRRHAGLQQFFAPVVMNALGGRDAEDTLAPREADVSVLFCDLRGFSRQSEKEQDRLLQLLERVSDALGLMTGHILASGGVIGDFHGDAAMGFWGWPLEQLDAPARASLAAIAILEEFQRAGADAEGHLADFRCGIGVASGRAVAGRIGTVDQVKVTAFGPVVNLASRLEGMTKQLGAEILVDEPTAAYLRQHVDTDVCRVRRLANVRPAGIESSLMVSQVLPPYGERCSLTNEHLQAYEEALDALLEKRWEHAFERLHDVPASDRAKDFLTVFIAQHGRVAPDDWGGTIDLPKR